MVFCRRLSLFQNPAYSNDFGKYNPDPKSYSFEQKYYSLLEALLSCHVDFLSLRNYLIYIELVMEKNVWEGKLGYQIIIHILLVYHLSWI